MRLLPLLAAVLAVTACTPRSHVFTYAKPGVKEDAFNQDVKTLAGTSGVTRVITRLDSQGNATLELYVDEDDQLPGQEKAAELGYQRVRH